MTKARISSGPFFFCCSDGTSRRSTSLDWFVTFRLAVDDLFEAAQAMLTRTIKRSWHKGNQLR
jgi:hypothetical protein